MLFSFVLPLALTLVAFEWTSWEVLPKKPLAELPDGPIIEVILPPIVPKSPIPPKPKAAKPMSAPPMVIEIVDGPDPFIDEGDAAIDDPPAPDDAVGTPITPRPEPYVEPIVPWAEIMPEFPGGESEMYAYLKRNLKLSDLCIASGSSGTIYITFEVDQAGRIKDVKVLRGIGGSCDEEVSRVVKAMPDWEPGRQGGRTVRVQYNLPIKVVFK